MLGYESEKRLKALLLVLGDGEQTIERARQRLCKIRDFAPHAAFQRIDRDALDFITGYNLLNYLRETGVFGLTESDTNKLVQYFDSDEDGRLSLQDFL